MKTRELRTKGKSELEAILDREQRLLRTFREENAKGRSKNVKEGKMHQRMIARVRTLLHEIAA